MQGKKVTFLAAVNGRISREEIASLLAQLHNTIESYGKLSDKEKEMLKTDIEQFEFALMEYNKE